MSEQERHIAIDAETLAGHRFPYQEDISLVEDIDLLAATPGEDINWLEDVELLEEEGVPAVFDRYSNSFLRIHFPIPEGRENEIARKVLIKHLQSGNSYGIQLKEQHCKFPQVELGPWVEGSRTVGTDWKPAVLEGWEPPVHEQRPITLGDFDASGIVCVPWNLPRVVKWKTTGGIRPSRPHAVVVFTRSTSATHRVPLAPIVSG